MVKRLVTGLALATAVALGGTVATAADDSGAVKPDNTKMNKEIRADKGSTADQQGESAADRAMTQKIRKAVIKDKALSTYAHNVKIITKDGMVSLKGPVKSQKEKAAVGRIAAKVAGKGKVTNDLEVAPPKSK